VVFASHELDRADQLATRTVEIVGGAVVGGPVTGGPTPDGPDPDGLALAEPVA
jgi:hypothetical protein